jgi:GntR family transcriptional regulator, gluconate operon transcriptional repressor
VSDRIGLESLPSDGKLSRSAHSLRVVHALREAIVSGGMAAGAPLVETAIARALGVSRGPVRTALHELHAQGLVEITPTGRSSVVGFDHARLLDLLSVRWQLESQAVRWGLERKHSLEDVISAYAAIEAADGASGEELAELDMVFHRALMAFSGSRALMSAWGALAPVVTTVLVVANRRTQLSAHQLNLLVRDLHTPLIDGLLSGDADEIARLLQRQFENTDYLRRVRPDVPTLTPPPSASGLR